VDDRIQLRHQPSSIFAAMRRVIQRETSSPVIAMKAVYADGTGDASSPGALGSGT
jgi:hypothetical protein